jgi:hypothetical protein
MTMVLCFLLQADAGQAYLDRLGEAWSGRLPLERTLGIYIGRKWIGQSQISIKAAPERSSATFEFIVKAETKFAGKKTKTHHRALLAKNLAPLSAESTHEDGETKSIKTLTIKKGRWKLRTNESEREGELQPGMTWSIGFLPLFESPESELSLVSLDAGPDPFTLKKEGDVLEIRQGDKPADRWMGDEFRPAGGPVRFKVVESSQIGKHIDEPLNLKPSERALADLFLAIKRNDRKGVDAAFDYAKMAEEMLPGYGELNEIQRRQTLETLRAKVNADLLKTRDGLPDELIMEDFIAASAETTEKDAAADVLLFGKTVWKLARNDKGRWLVVSIANKP